MPRLTAAGFRASLTVEAALLFPFILLLLFFFMQFGLKEVCRLKTEALCREGDRLYGEALRRGESRDQALAAAREHIVNGLKTAPGQVTETVLSDKDRLLYKKLSFRVRFQFCVFFPETVTVDYAGEYRRPRDVRDAVVLTEELGRRIPAVKEAFGRYEQWIQECISKVKE